MILMRVTSHIFPTLVSLCLFKYSVYYTVTPLLSGRTAIAVTEFQDYVQRMMREDQNKKSMLANDYNVSVRLRYTWFCNFYYLTTHSVGSSKTTSSKLPSGLSLS